MIFETSDDARCIYNAKATVKSYSASSNTNPAFVIHQLDEEQFKYILANVESNTPVQCIVADGQRIILNLGMQLKCVYDNKSGKSIKLSFKYNELIIDTVRSLIDKEVELTMIEGEVAEKVVKPKGEHGKYAGLLMQSKLMRNRGFWECVGSEDAYLDWVRGNPCMLTGKSVETDSGEKRVEAAHVRDLKYGAGVATKPEYFAIPLHPKVHKDQHEKGIYDMWRKAGRPTPSGMTYPIRDEEDHVRKWLAYRTLDYIRKWIQFEIKKYFNVESLSFVSEDMMHGYIRDKCPQEVHQGLINLSQERV